MPEFDRTVIRLRMRDPVRLTHETTKGRHET